MDQDQMIKELKRNRAVFESLLRDADEKHFRWKPAPDKWCLLEVLCHLVDEEREDFRARVRHCLETPELSFPQIDPVGWVKGRDYINQGFGEKLNQFLLERENSVDWLSSLKNPRWESAHDHPKFGKMSANLFLSNWLAHDLIHIRQITKINYAYLNEFTDDSLDYAGNW